MRIMEEKVFINLLLAPGVYVGRRCLVLQCFPESRTLNLALKIICRSKILEILDIMRVATQRIPVGVSLFAQVRTKAVSSQDGIPMTWQILPSLVSLSFPDITSRSRRPGNPVRPQDSEGHRYMTLRFSCPHLSISAPWCFLFLANVRTPLEERISGPEVEHMLSSSF